MKILFLFLDFDGVLNRHTLGPNNNGIDPRCVRYLNALLGDYPEIQIVVSSSWRYLVHSGKLTLKEFEEVLVEKGFNCKDKLHGITKASGLMPENLLAKEDESWTIDQRVSEIEDYIKKYTIEEYVILDDLPLGCKHLVKTSPVNGLTRDEYLLLYLKFQALKKEKHAVHRYYP